MIKKILEKVGLRESYFERRVYALALKKIDLDFYKYQRSRLIQYSLELYGRVDYESLERGLSSITPPSVRIKENLKKGYCLTGHHELINDYKPLIRNELKEKRKLKGK